MDGKNGVFASATEITVWTGDDKPVLTLPYFSGCDPKSLASTMKAALTQYRQTFSGIGPWTDPGGRRDAPTFPYRRQIAEVILSLPWEAAVASLTGTRSVPTVYPVSRTTLLREFFGAELVELLDGHLVIDGISEPWRSGTLTLIECARECCATLCLNPRPRPRPIGTPKSNVFGGWVRRGFTWVSVNGFVVADVAAFWKTVWPQMIKRYLNEQRNGERGPTRRRSFRPGEKTALIDLATRMGVVPGALCSKTGKPITDSKRLAKRRSSFREKMTRPIKYTGCAEGKCPPHGMKLSPEDIASNANTVTALCPIEEVDRSQCRKRAFGDRPRDVLAAAMASNTLAPPCVRAFMARAGDKERFAGAAMFRIAYETVHERSSLC